MNNRKSMEFKILVIWLFIIITLVVVLFIIRAITSDSKGIIDTIIEAFR